MALELPRRKFLTGLFGGMVAAAAAPAIVRVSSLMQISVLPEWRDLPSLKLPF